MHSVVEATLKASSKIASPSASYGSGFWGISFHSGPVLSKSGCAGLPAMERSDRGVQFMFPCPISLYPRPLASGVQEKSAFDRIHTLYVRFQR